MSGKRKRDGAGAAVPAAAAAGGDGLQQFQKAVQDLKNKSQSKITVLTTLADTLYVEAKHVAKILTDEVRTAQVARIQPLISVVDSILKKVGKDYKTHLSTNLPEALRAAHAKSDATMHGWLQKMVNESWRKHDLLPGPVLDQLDQVFRPAPPESTVAPAVESRAPPGHAGPAQAAASLPPTLGAAQQTSQLPAEALRRAGSAPPMKAPPPQKSQPTELPASAQGSPTATTSAAAQAAAETPEIVERRLGILTKIIERRNPGHEELQEIMKVPEIRRAIAMQQKGDRQKAMAVLSQFKQELERKHSEFGPVGSAAPAAAAPVGESSQTAARPKDPRQMQDPKAADPRQADAKPQEAKPLDPRQQDPRQSQPKSADPGQAERPQDPRQRVSERASTGMQMPVGEQEPPAGAVAGAKRAAESEAATAPAKHARVPDASARPGAPLAGASHAADAAAAPSTAEAAGTEAISDDEAARANGGMSKSLVPARQILQGLPSIGFSEAWLRQFLEQMPTKSQPKAPLLEAPSVGRKVLGASGDQIVYVDETSPNEMLLLMQFIFLLEERLRRNGNGLDLTQRIPHTFSYLQVEPAVDVMLKRLFNELPFQCTTTGLRFASQEKLRKHHDALYKRKAQAQQLQRGAEARGWMESIPEWVGNRDLVFGAALFRVGEAGEEGQKVQEAQSRPQAGGSDDEDGEAEPGCGRWIVPLDERRSVCPISGEQLTRTWSPVFNDWAFTDAVAVEVGAPRPLRFPPGGPQGPHGLSETAVLMKKSCFFSTTQASRLQALDECRKSAGVARRSADAKLAPPKDEPPRTSIAGIPAPKKAAAPKPAAPDSALAALAASRPPPRKFF